MGLAPARRPAFFRLVLREASFQSLSRAQPFCRFQIVAGRTGSRRLWSIVAVREIMRDSQDRKTVGTASRQIEKLTEKLIPLFAQRGP